MTEQKKTLLSLRVPATSANMGSGFDTLGIALTLYNEFSVTKLLGGGEFRAATFGEGENELRDPANNMLITSYLRACREWGVEPTGFEAECRSVIPLCRGLGSSSSAVVAGVMIADALAGLNKPRDEMMRVMTMIEGHPDNVVPCFAGGMTVSSWDGSGLRTIKLPGLPQHISAVAAIPDCMVRTEDARAALPASIPFKDAVFNVGRASMLCAAWAAGRWDLLSYATEDRLHQPYRAKLFPGGAEILEKMRGRCLAVTISGSGPTMLAFTDGDADAIAREMCSIFAECGVNARHMILHGTDEGAEIKAIRNAEFGMRNERPL